ncbi:hypothetical protein HanOQP8_Chr14g0522161 [Helianthus annuus]|nr:hypothetical protein HanHA89_Chr14g0561511 [Helianthus annuus]KAJ0655408.1 hypothetical protein HanLR1_Chr14g0523831 [Helianthus annuus]KAJ0659101.1 hypothetical protein HanOQP8_Chr14g0522161 [Helianthus annuus]
MVNHNQLPQSKAIGLPGYHYLLIQTTVVKQELRFTPKLSRMSALMSPREMMTILNMAVAQLKMLQVQLKMVQAQVQARMDQNMNHQGKLLILRQMSHYLRANPIRSLNAWSLHEEGVVVVYERLCPVFNI